MEKVGRQDIEDEEVLQMNEQGSDLEQRLQQTDTRELESTRRSCVHTCMSTLC